jgi:hypothetical protein
MAAYVGDKVGDADAARLAEFEARLDPADAKGAALLEEMRAQLKKVGGGLGGLGGYPGAGAPLGGYPEGRGAAGLGAPGDCRAQALGGQRAPRAARRAPPTHHAQPERRVGPAPSRNQPLPSHPSFKTSSATRTRGCRSPPPSSRRRSAPSPTRSRWGGA